MKRKFLSKFLTSGLLFQTIFFTSAFAQIEDERAFGNKSAGEKRIALVLGNSDYDASIGKLKNPVNDANDMAAALKRLGFSLIGGKPQFNLNRRQTLEQIREFGNQIKQGGVGLFYFAGHGVQVDRRNYLIPITDSLKYQEDAEFEAVDVDAILREMEYADNALNILILDACRNNALPKKTRNLKDGLTEPNRKPSGVYIAFAARDGQTASENSSGRNGLYTQELLKNLETPNLRLEDIFIRTRVKVKELSKRTQEPIEYGSLDSEFYLRLDKNAVQMPINNVKGEQVFWQETERTNSISGYEKYLTEYPNGEFTKVAKIRLGKLKWEKFKPIAQKLIKYDEFRGQNSEYFTGKLLPRKDLILVKKEGYYGFINRLGDEIITPKYDYADLFYEDLAIIKTNGKYGFINKSGKEIIPVKYDFAERFSDGLAFVCLNERCGFIDKNNREVISMQYDQHYPYSSFFENGVAVIERDKKCGLIDKNGKEIISPKYDSMDPFFSEGLLRVQLNGKVGFINKEGMEVIPTKYDSAGVFIEGFAWVGIGEVYRQKYGFVDKTGKVVIPIKYDLAGDFSEGLAMVGKGDFPNEKQGYIDKSGNEVIPFKFDLADEFSEQAAVVKLNDKWGFIDKRGNEIGLIKYKDSPDRFIDGIAVIDLDDKFGFIDKTGREIFTPKFEDYLGYYSRTFLENGFFTVKLNGKKGFVDIYGNEYFDF